LFLFANIPRIFVCSDSVFHADFLNIVQFWRQLQNNATEWMYVTVLLSHVHWCWLSEAERDGTVIFSECVSHHLFVSVFLGIRLLLCILTSDVAPLHNFCHAFHANTTFLGNRWHDLACVLVRLFGLSKRWYFLAGDSTLLFATQSLSWMQ